MHYPIKGECRNTGRTRFKKGAKFSKVHKANLRKARLKDWEKRGENRISKKGRENLRKSHLQEKSPFWRGGKDRTIRLLIYDHYKTRQWRSKVFERDNWICQTCRKRGCFLEAHHIKPFYKILEENNIKDLTQAIKCKELWNINNGVTLCKDCHNLTKQGRKGVKY